MTPQPVHVIGKRFHMPSEPRYTVLTRGEYYDVDERRLAALEAGATPQRLGLEPIEPGNEGEESE